jgi:dynein light chain LC8-type
MAGTEAIVKISSMHPDIEQDCVDCASHALTTLKEQKAIAQWIKRELDQKYGPTWHVICGRQFGSYVSHHDRSFIYFFIGDLGFLMWKTESIPEKMQRKLPESAAAFADKW